MIRFVVCPRCGLVLAIGGSAKKTTCPKCQAPATVRPSGQIETKSTRQEAAA